MSSRHSDDESNPDRNQFLPRHLLKFGTPRCHLAKVRPNHQPRKEIDYSLHASGDCRLPSNRYAACVSYRTVEVELENGRIRPRGTETLPPRANALLTILTPVSDEAIDAPENGSLAELVGDLAGIGRGLHTDLFAWTGRSGDRRYDCGG